MSNYKLGKVTRPENGSGNKNVTLTAAVTKGTASGTKTFNMRVIEMGLSDAQSVQRALVNVVVPGADAVTGNLTLINVGDYGTSITWASDKPTVISALGVVTRPANGEADATVKLTATVTKGTASEQKEITCTVKAWTDAEEVQVAYDMLTWEAVRSGNNAVDSITGNMNLMTVGERNAQITWVSTNAAVISNAGIVTRPAYLDGDAIVSLTATIVVGEESTTKQFVGLKVIKLPITNTETVLLAKNALTEVDFLGTNTSLINVIGDMNLPRKSDDALATNASISWSQKKQGTQNPSTFMTLSEASDTVILADITRPSAADETVELTATISSVGAAGNAATDTKVFVVKIVKQ